MGGLIILAVVIIAGLVTGMFLKKRRKIINIATAGLSMLLLVFMCVSPVSAKNVGVVVTFGAVDENTRAPGINFILPWSDMIQIDGTIQPDSHTKDTCIPVRIGDGSQACADVVNRWYINPEKGAQIYESFRSDDPTQQFASSVINTNLAQVVQEVLADYNPIAQLEKVDGNESSSEMSFAPDYAAVSAEIEERMKEHLAEDNLAYVESITFSYLRLADSTQKKLDDYVAAIGETRIAQQREATAKAQANANNTLSSSVSNDPNVLVSRCYDIVADAVNSGYQLPAGFSCWGQSSAVIIPGTSNQGAVPQ